MKLWVVLVAVTLLAGCGAELTPPEPTTPPPSRIWGYLGVLGEAAENATVRLREVPLIQKLQSLMTELKTQATSLSVSIREEMTEARDRAAEYGADARAALDQSWGELKNRGAAYARKLRKRLSRDGEELRRRWDVYGQALGDRAAALRKSWGVMGRILGEPGVPQNSED
ncbi:apolipoprotein E-like [Grus americana]|uniref:apolipoprotein E-like n=1 Tax=Grus americana TaxID=9117 RepID=UPI002407ECAB|nr:apolipoprotein E-like [Grus americana]